MPKYEFVCEKCGKSKLVYAKMGDEIKVPRCCGETMRRIWTTAFILRGDGWAWRPNDEIPTEYLPPRRRGKNNHD